MRSRKQQEGSVNCAETAEEAMHISIVGGIEAARAGIADYWESDCANLPDPETFERMVFATVERERFNDEQRLTARITGTTPILI